MSADVNVSTAAEALSRLVSPKNAAPSGSISPSASDGALQRDAASDVVVRMVERALIERDATVLPLCFDITVLEKYRAEGHSLTRTINAGRVRSADGWAFDFGIVDEAGVIHVAVADVLPLPRAERRHLAAHIITSPLNERFLKMRLGAGACIDEGEITEWDGRPWDL